MTRTGDAAEIVLRFHGLTMNGGFNLAFAAAPDRLNEVEAAFESLGLLEAAGLIREGTLLIPAIERARIDWRVSTLDDLDDSTGTQLEELGERYIALVSDADLGRAIEAANTEPQPPIAQTTSEALASIIDTSAEADRLRDAGMVAAANQIMDRLHRLYTLFGETEEGRAAIRVLQHHPIPRVRLQALVESLPWDEDTAVALLHELERSGEPQALGAKWGTPQMAVRSRRDRPRRLATLGPEQSRRKPPPYSRVAPDTHIVRQPPPRVAETAARRLSPGSRRSSFASGALVDRRAVHPCA